jgi:hypothetical protein
MGKGGLVMKKLLAAFLLLPALAQAASNDLFINQRNSTDTATLSRTVTIPAAGANGLFGFNGSTVLPVFYTLGPGLTLSGSVLDTVPGGVVTWASITGKPAFATVATSGAYADLSGQPVIPAAQVQTDWNATTGLGVLLNKPTLATVATAGTFAALTSKPTTLAGYGITDGATAAQLATKFNIPAGTTAQYLRGDGSTATFPTAVSAFTNDSGYITGISSAQVTAALGFTPYNSTNPSGYVTQAGARAAVSLTTAGTAGAATYNSSTGVLNIPNYAPGTGTVTSITAGTGLPGGTITTSGTISLPNTGTAGTYSGVTTDPQGRVTAGTVRSQAAATRALNTAFQVSSTRDALVTYSVQITVSASITGGQNGDVVLEIASDSGFTANVQTVAISGLGQTYTLAVALAGVQPQTGVVSGMVPAGYYARLRTVNNTGTPTYAYRAGQETLL